MANAQPILPSKAPKRILVISMRHIGDVLLATPVTRSLRHAFPTAQLDVLAYKNTAAILEGNPDIDNIITTDQKPTLPALFKLILRLFRKYDLCVSTQTGDRPTVYALLSAPYRVGEVPPRNEKGWWKRHVFQRWTEFDDVSTHTVIQHMRLIDLLSIPRQYELVTPKALSFSASQYLQSQSDYAVLHVYPMWTYKRWALAHWSETGRYLSEKGLKIILSGSPAENEQHYIAELAKTLPAETINLAGKTSLAQLTEIYANAKIYIGPDTGTTHLAAATGIPVIAIYGPTNPVKWAPWPFGYCLDKNPFSRVGSQLLNNIHLIQGQADCVPCHLEGCERHRQSHSLCLDTLNTEQIKLAIDQILEKQSL